MDYTTRHYHTSVFLNTLPPAFRLGPVIHREHLALHKEALNPLPSKHTDSKEGQVLLRDF